MQKARDPVPADVLRAGQRQCPQRVSEYGPQLSARRSYRPLCVRGDAHWLAVRSTRFEKSTFLTSVFEFRPPCYASSLRNRSISPCESNVSIGFPRGLGERIAPTTPVVSRRLSCFLIDIVVRSVPFPRCNGFMLRLLWQSPKQVPRVPLPSRVRNSLLWKRPG